MSSVGCGPPWGAGDVRDVASKGGADMAVIQQDQIGGDLAGVYDRLAAETVDASKKDGRAEGTANMPWGEMPASLALQMLADDDGRGSTGAPTISWVSITAARRPDRRWAR
jgi:hypothetical protein